MKAPGINSLQDIADLCETTGISFDKLMASTDLLCWDLYLALIGRKVEIANLPAPDLSAEAADWFYTATTDKFTEILDGLIRDREETLFRVARDKLCDMFKNLFE